MALRMWSSSLCSIEENDPFGDLCCGHCTHCGFRDEHCFVMVCGDCCAEVSNIPVTSSVFVYVQHLTLEWLL